MFCTACPAMPLIRLSKAEKMTALRPFTAMLISQRFVPTTEAMRGELSTCRTKGAFRKVPKGQEAAFGEAFARAVHTLFPTIEGNADYAL